MTKQSSESSESRDLEYRWEDFYIVGPDIADPCSRDLLKELIALVLIGQDDGKSYEDLIAALMDLGYPRDIAKRIIKAAGINEPAPEKDDYEP